MPGGTGLALAAEVLGKGPEAGARRVILITAHGWMVQAVEALRSGVYDFLTKPFSLEDAAAPSAPRWSGRWPAVPPPPPAPPPISAWQRGRGTSAGLSDRLTQALERLQAAGPRCRPRRARPSTGCA